MVRQKRKLKSIQFLSTNVFMRASKVQVVREAEFHLIYGIPIGCSTLERFGEVRDPCEVLSDQSQADGNSTTNQSEFEANTCNHAAPRAGKRNNEREQVKFLTGWESGASLLTNHRA